MSSPCTRREIVLRAAAAGAAGWTRLYAFSSDFWDKKPPSEWSVEEVQKLKTKSPWAKEVSAQMQSSPEGGGGMGGGRAGGGMGIPGIGGMGGGRRGGMGGGGRRPMQQFKG